MAKEAIYLISNKKNNKNIPGVYDKYNEFNIVILKNSDFACALKYDQNRKYLILTKTCLLHPFEKFIYIDSKEGEFCCPISALNNNKITLHESKTCEPTNFVLNIFRFLESFNSHDISTSKNFSGVLEYFNFTNIEDKNDLVRVKEACREFLKNKNFTLDFETENFYKFFFRFLYNSEPHNKQAVENFVCEDSRTQFLVKKLNFAERLKYKTNFGIFITSKEFLERALLLKRYLEKINKNVYLHFLKDVTYMRLKNFDGIQCVILYECEFIFKTIEKNIDIPLVRPYEILMAFEKWEGDYLYNFVLKEPPAEISNDTRIMVKGESIGQLVKNNEAAAINYNIEENKVVIEKGHDGIASNYKSEYKEE